MQRPKTRRARGTSTRSLFNSKALLHLNAASDPGQFWKAVQVLLARTAPASTRWLCLHPIRMASAMLLLKGANADRDNGADARPGIDEGEDDAAFLKELFARHPAIVHLCAEDRRSLIHLNAAQCGRARTMMGRRWPRMSGARFGVALAFWQRRQLQGVLLLHRTETEGDFSESELAHLRELHPHFETALNRIVAARGREAQKRLLAGIIRPLPLALVLCDWRLKIVYETAAGLEARAAWESGSARTRLVKPSARRALPADLIDYCRNLISLWETGDSLRRAALEVTGNAIPHRQASVSGAWVSLVRSKGCLLSKPFFLFRFRAPDAGHKPADQAMLLAKNFEPLSRLSAAERDLALLVCDGFSNAGMARQLGKSLHTIKAQLRSVFGKVEVRNRVGLVTRLMGNAALWTFMCFPDRSGVVDLCSRVVAG